MPTTFHRRVTALSLLTWPALLALAALVQPTLSEDPASAYDTAGTFQGRLIASDVLGVIGIMGWVLGLTGLLYMSQGRGARLTRVGSSMGLLGALGHMAIAVLYLVLVAIPAPADREALVDALDRIASTVFPVSMPLMMLGALGLVVLAFGLRRSGRAPALVPALVTASVLVEFIPLPGVAGDVLVWGLLTVAFGIVGAGLLTEDAAVPTPATTTPNALVAEPS
jgi:hypothetical protein